MADEIGLAKICNRKNFSQIFIHCIFVKNNATIPDENKNGVKFMKNLSIVLILSLFAMASEASLKLQATKEIKIAEGTEQTPIIVENGECNLLHDKQNYDRRILIDSLFNISEVKRGLTAPLDAKYIYYSTVKKIVLGLDNISFEDFTKNELPPEYTLLDFLTVAEKKSGYKIILADKNNNFITLTEFTYSIQSVKTENILSLKCRFKTPKDLGDTGLSHLLNSSLEPVRDL